MTTDDRNLRKATDECIEILKEAKLNWIGEITSRNGRESVTIAHCSRVDAIRAVGRFANMFNLSLKHIKAAIKLSSEDMDDDSDKIDGSKRIDQVIEGG